MRSKAANFHMTLLFTCCADLRGCVFSNVNVEGCASIYLSTRICVYVCVRSFSLRLSVRYPLACADILGSKYLLSKQEVEEVFPAKQLRQLVLFTHNIF